MYPFYNLPIRRSKYDDLTQPREQLPVGPLIQEEVAPIEGQVSIENPPVRDIRDVLPAAAGWQMKSITIPEAIRQQRQAAPQVERRRTQLGSEGETQFQQWYGLKAKQLGLNPDPDAPDHKYDYRGAFAANEGPDASGHWPSRFKDPDHPRRFLEIDGVMTDTTKDEGISQAKIPAQTGQEPGTIDATPAQRGAAEFFKQGATPPKSRFERLTEQVKAQQMAKTGKPMAIGKETPESDRVRVGFQVDTPAGKNASMQDIRDSIARGAGMDPDKVRTLEAYLGHPLFRFTPEEEASAVATTNYYRKPITKTKGEQAAYGHGTINRYASDTSIPKSALAIYEAFDRAGPETAVALRDKFAQMEAQSGRHEVGDAERAGLQTQANKGYDAMKLNVAAGAAEGAIGEADFWRGVGNATGLSGILDPGNQLKGVTDAGKQQLQAAEPELDRSTFGQKIARGLTQAGPSTARMIASGAVGGGIPGQVALMATEGYLSKPDESFDARMKAAANMGAMPAVLGAASPLTNMITNPYAQAAARGTMAAGFMMGQDVLDNPKSDAASLTTAALMGLGFEIGHVRNAMKAGAERRAQNRATAMEPPRTPDLTRPSQGGRNQKTTVTNVESGGTRYANPEEAMRSPEFKKKAEAFAQRPRIAQAVAVQASDPEHPISQALEQNGITPEDLQTSVEKRDKSADELAKRLEVWAQMESKLHQLRAQREQIAQQQQGAQQKLLTGQVPTGPELQNADQGAALDQQIVEAETMQQEALNDIQTVSPMFQNLRDRVAQEQEKAEAKGQGSTRPLLPVVGDTIEFEAGAPEKTVRGEVVRLQVDPVTGDQVPIVKTAGGEWPAAEWHVSGRVVEGQKAPLSTRLAEAIARESAPVTETVTDAQEERPDLLKEVRREGGMTSESGAEAGELRRLGAREAQTTGITQKGGLAPDEMRERMVSEGFSTAETSSQFIDEVENELRNRGKKKEDFSDYAEYADAQLTPEEQVQSAKLSGLLKDPSHPFTQAFRKLENPKVPFSGKLVGDFATEAAKEGFDDDFIENWVSEGRSSRGLGVPASETGHKPVAGASAESKPAPIPGADVHAVGAGLPILQRELDDVDRRIARAQREGEESGELFAERRRIEAAIRETTGEPEPVHDKGKPPKPPMYPARENANKVPEWMRGRNIEKMGGAEVTEFVQKLREEKARQDAAGFDTIDRGVRDTTTSLLEAAEAKRNALKKAGHKVPPINEPRAKGTAEQRTAREQAATKEREAEEAKLPAAYREDVTALSDEKLAKRIKDAETAHEMSKDKPGYMKSELGQRRTQYLAKLKAEQEKRAAAQPKEKKPGYNPYQTQEERIGQVHEFKKENREKLQRLGEKFNGQKQSPAVDGEKQQQTATEEKETTPTTPAEVDKYEKGIGSAPISESDRKDLIARGEGFIRILPQSQQRKGTTHQAFAIDKESGLIASAFGQNADEAHAGAESIIFRTKDIKKSRAEGKPAPEKSTKPIAEVNHDLPVMDEDVIPFNGKNWRVNLSAYGGAMLVAVDAHGDPIPAGGGENVLQYKTRAEMEKEIGRPVVTPRIAQTKNSEKRDWNHDRLNKHLDGQLKYLKDPELEKQVIDKLRSLEAARQATTDLKEFEKTDDHQARITGTLRRLLNFQEAIDKNYKRADALGRDNTRHRLEQLLKTPNGESEAHNEDLPEYVDRQREKTQEKKDAKDAEKNPLFADQIKPTKPEETKPEPKTVSESFDAAFDQVFGKKKEAKPEETRPGELVHQSEMPPGVGDIVENPKGKQVSWMDIPESDKRNLRALLTDQPDKNYIVRQTDAKERKKGMDRYIALVHVNQQGIYIPVAATGPTPGDAHELANRQLEKDKKTMGLSSGEPKITRTRGDIIPGAGPRPKDPEKAVIDAAIKLKGADPTGTRIYIREVMDIAKKQGFSEHEVHQALRDLGKASKISLMRLDDPTEIKADDRRYALTQGGQDNHIFYVQPKALETAKPAEAQPAKKKAWQMTFDEYVAYRKDIAQRAGVDMDVFNKKNTPELLEQDFRKKFVDAVNAGELSPADVKETIEKAMAKPEAPKTEKLDKAIEGLGKLFPKKKKGGDDIMMSREEAPPIDMAVYREAKALFDDALSHYEGEGKTPHQGMIALLQELKARDFDADQVADMRPYIERYMTERTQAETFAPEKAVEPMQQVGTKHRIRGVDMELTAVERHGGVDYELYKAADGKGGALRLRDPEVGENVALNVYPDFDRAEHDYQQSLKYAARDNERPISKNGHPERPGTDVDGRRISDDQGSDSELQTQSPGDVDQRGNRPGGGIVDASGRSELESQHGEPGTQPETKGNGPAGVEPLATKEELAATEDTESQISATGETVVEGMADSVPPEPVKPGDKVPSKEPKATSKPQIADEPPAVQRHILTGASFAFTPETIEAIQTGGKMTKYRQNVRAIELMREIVEAGRNATIEEQEQLALYAGFGGIKEVFAPHDYRIDRKDRDKWLEAQAELKRLIGEEDFKAANQSTQNAHYTDPRIVQAQWEMVKRLGFTGGRVLEPSMGSGNFLGLAPADIREKTGFTGVELDPTTAQIAKLIYPDANIKQMGFQNLIVPDNFYDLVIGNVPFGGYTVSDHQYNKFHALVHNYFFLKAIDKVRPGGIVALITSTGTMDAERAQNVRNELYKKADLVDVVRLPEDTFKNALTSVVTDLVILRKRMKGEKPGDDLWTKTEAVTNPAEGYPDIQLNSYLAKNRDKMLGTFNGEARTVEGTRANVARTDDFEDRLKKFIESLPENLMARAADVVADVQEAEKGTKSNSYTVKDSQLYRNEKGVLLPVKADARRIERITGMLKTRDVLNALTDAEMGRTNESADDLRKALNTAYDRHVAKFGPMSSKENMAAMEGDPDLPRLMALEDYNLKTKKATKKPIFTRSTIVPPKTQLVPKDMPEAIGKSLSLRGHIDLEAVAQDLNISQADAAATIYAKGLAFKTPGGNWELPGQYLSGNVRQKLYEAKAAAESDETFEANVKALEAVVPPDIPYTDIQVGVGAPWQEPRDIVDFIVSLFGDDPSHVKVHYDRHSGAYQVAYDPRARAKISKIAETTWGTSRRPFDKLMDLALEGRPAKVMDEIPAPTPDNPNRTKMVVNVKDTQEANVKLDAIKERFKAWIWEDEARKERLVKTYHDHLRSTAKGEYEGQVLGSQLPGMNPSSHLRPHQAAAVLRAVVDRRGLMAHEVGLGKTLAMIGSASELKRLGIARKPAIAVPKKVIPGFKEAVLQHFPGLRLHVVDTTDAISRQRTTSEIATGDHDLVLMTHENMGAMKMKPEFEARILNKELDEINAVYSAMMAERRGRGQGSNAADAKILASIKKRRDNLAAKIQNALNSPLKDDTIYFEDTGIDFLFVDEFHKFKSLPVVTAMGQIKGVPGGDSQRAVNMLMKARYLQEIQNGGGLIAATGTPVGNTLVEAYIMAKFIQPDVMERSNVESFDAWARNFASVVDALELGADGRMKMVARMSDFRNLPELQSLSRVTLDVKTAKETGILEERPKRIDKVIKVQLDPEQKLFMQYLRERADAFRGGNSPAGDNFLVISHDGRMQSADIRNVLPGMEDKPSKKIEALVDNVMRIRGEKPGTTQMIFCNVGVHPNAWGFHLYGEIIKRLVQAGIPENKIIDFSKMNTDAKVETAQKRLRSGDAEIALGHRDSMGTGVNAQDLMSAVHQFDATWKPLEVEQSEARGWRQGNKNKEIEILSYVAEGSFDAVMWGIVARKQGAISKFLKGNITERTLSEEDGESLSYDEIAAAASGDPDYLRKAELDQRVFKLSGMESAHRSNILARQQAIPQLREGIRAKERAAAAYDALAKFAERIDKQDFNYTDEGKVFSDKTEAGKHFVTEVARLREKNDKATASQKQVYVLGKIKGLNVVLQEYGRVRVNLPSSWEYGDGQSFILTVDTTSADAFKPENVVKAFDEFDSDIARLIKNDGAKNIREVEIPAAQRDIAELEAEQSAPFPYEEELATARRQLERVSARLRAKEGEARDAGKPLVTRNGLDVRDIGHLGREVRHGVREGDILETDVPGMLERKIPEIRIGTAQKVREYDEYMRKKTESLIKHYGLEEVAMWEMAKSASRAQRALGDAYAEQQEEKAKAAAEGRDDILMNRPPAERTEAQKQYDTAQDEMFEWETFVEGAGSGEFEPQTERGKQAWEDAKTQMQNALYDFPDLITKAKDEQKALKAKRKEIQKAYDQYDKLNEKAAEELKDKDIESIPDEKVRKEVGDMIKRQREIHKELDAIEKELDPLTDEYYAIDSSKNPELEARESELDEQIQVLQERQEALEGESSEIEENVNSAFLEAQQALEDGPLTEHDEQIDELDTRIDELTDDWKYLKKFARGDFKDLPDERNVSTDDAVAALEKVDGILTQTTEKLQTSLDLLEMKADESDAALSRPDRGSVAVRDVADAGDLFYHAQMIVKNRGKRGAQVFMNDHMRLILGEALTTSSGEDRRNLNAVSLNRTDLGLAKDALAAEAATNRAHKDEIFRLVEQIEDLLADNPKQQSFNFQDVTPFAKRKEAETPSQREAIVQRHKDISREERFHWSQRAIGGQRLAQVGASWLQATKGWGKYRRALLARGYPDRPEILGAEIAAQIASYGTTLKAEGLGIKTEADAQAAETWLTKYFERVADLYGLDALDKFGSLVKEANKAREAAKANVITGQTDTQISRREAADAARTGANAPRAPGSSGRPVQGGRPRSQGRQTQGGPNLYPQPPSGSFEGRLPSEVPETVRGVQPALPNTPERDNIRQFGEEAPGEVNAGPVGTQKRMDYGEKGEVVPIGGQMPETQKRMSFGEAPEPPLAGGEVWQASPRRLDLGGSTASPDEPIFEGPPVGPQPTLGDVPGMRRAENIRQPGEQPPGEVNWTRRGTATQPPLGEHGGWGGENVRGHDEAYPGEFDQAPRYDDPKQERLYKEKRDAKYYVDSIQDLWSVPKSLMASGDFSAVFRQGLFLTIPPTQWHRALKAAGRMLMSTDIESGVVNKIGKLREKWTGEKFTPRESDYNKFVYNLRRNKGYKDAKAAGMYFGVDDKPGSRISDREEGFASRFASEIPWVKMSEKAYKTYLDSLRLDTFNKYKKIIDKQLRDPGERFEAYKAAADWLNTSTGRGNFGNGRFGQFFNKSLPFLNVFFFAPRYVASRIQMLNPWTYAKNAVDPNKRMVFRQQMSELFQSAAMLVATGALARAAGATINFDPDDSDFMKIRFGSTRWDVLAGLQQVARLGIKIGEWVNAEFTEDDPAVLKAKRRGLDIYADKYERTKYSPQMSFITDWLHDWTSVTGERHAPGDFIGSVEQGFGANDPKMIYKAADDFANDPIMKQFLPIFFSDMVSAWHNGFKNAGDEQEAALHMIKAIPSVVGVGVQDYDRPEFQTGAKKVLDDLGIEPGFPKKKKYETDADLIKRTPEVLKEQSEIIQEFNAEKDLQTYSTEIRREVLKDAISEKGRERMAKMNPEWVKKDWQVQANIEEWKQEMEKNPIFKQMSPQAKESAARYFGLQMSKYRAGVGQKPHPPRFFSEEFARKLIDKSLNQ